MPCCCNKKTKEEPLEIVCPVQATLNLIGGKYKSMILWKLVDGTHRYSELQRIVPQATPKMLTQQLRELESDGLIIRTVYPVVPPKVEYSLTEKGRSLYPILQAIYDWGTEYLEEKGVCPNCAMKK